MNEKGEKSLQEESFFKIKMPWNNIMYKEEWQVDYFCMGGPIKFWKLYKNEMDGLILIFFYSNNK